MRYEFSYEPGASLGDDLVVATQLSCGPVTEIYEAWSRSRLCPFACKLLRPEAARDTRHARHMEHERAVLSRLDHPHIVRMYKRSPGLDVPHVLMEFLPGPSLLELLEAAPRRRLKVEDAVRHAIRVGSALAHIHAQGFVYRDLKPANVVMREGAPVLVDLGSAYRWKPGRAPRERVGTDPYMAPEQCLKRAIGPAADVFGLGAVTYELLTGEWPFEDQLMNVFDRSRLHTRFPQVAYKPGLLRQRAAAVPPELEAIVLKCLARRPSQRYATVAEVVFALNAVLGRGRGVVPDPLESGPTTAGQAA